MPGPLAVLKWLLAYSHRVPTILGEVYTAGRRGGLAGIGAWIGAKYRGWSHWAREDKVERRRLKAGYYAREFRAWVMEFDTLSSEDVAAIDEQISTFQHRPRVSLLMPVSPVSGVSAQQLGDTLDSLLAQRYIEWELNVVCGASAPHADPSGPRASGPLRSTGPRRVRGVADGRIPCPGSPPPGDRRARRHRRAGLCPLAPRALHGLGGAEPLPRRGPDLHGRGRARREERPGLAPVQARLESRSPPLDRLRRPPRRLQDRARARRRWLPGGSRRSSRLRPRSPVCRKDGGREDPSRPARPLPRPTGPSRASGREPGGARRAREADAPLGSRRGREGFPERSTSATRSETLRRA